MTTKRIPKLHELLAAEKTVTSAFATMLAETESKFGKEQFFQGNDKTLTLLVDSPAKESTERAARETRPLTTTVPDTLNYIANIWARAEDLLFQKNTTNQLAKADIEFRGKVIAQNVSIDELMGLEARLVIWRGLVQKAPTIDASKKWVSDSVNRNFTWKLDQPEVAVKTEKDIQSVVLYEATDKHPAQIKEISKDVVVGAFSNMRFSGAITSRAKADSLAIIDELISEVKKSRTRANDVEVVPVNIGETITDILLEPIRNQQV